ncbi:hypothetical protein LS482_13960 [Sinomicrobium kalidii]|uniref:hypothetical protein n=1 Tax=Sinomicrobium kalidii TaxID=2900738 RepID=UPI001E2BAC2E|nr:hypothetical protein [Sinomicrobium kalidii]UGU14797.1 hypothetical protein LS482_13960 [Sinomicrobium kalidii]
MKIRIHYFQILKTPFYEIEVKTNDCPVEVLVNDVPCFANYRKGGMAVDWLINENILETGRQHFEIRSFPYEGEAEIRDNAFIKVKIYVRDAFVENAPRALVEEFPLIEFKGKKRQQYSYQNIFAAKVPYQNEGWKNSVDLLNEDKDKLLEELTGRYDELLRVFRSKDQTEYDKINKERIEELTIANYWDDATVKREQERSFSSLPAKINKVPIENYQLMFYGNGKIVALKLPYRSPGFVYVLEKDKKQDFLEFALFYRKDREGDLKLIR